MISFSSQLAIDELVEIVARQIVISERSYLIRPETIDKIVIEAYPHDEITTTIYLSGKYWRSPKPLKYISDFWSPELQQLIDWVIENGGDGIIIFFHRRNNNIHLFTKLLKRRKPHA